MSSFSYFQHPRPDDVSFQEWGVYIKGMARERQKVVDYLDRRSRELAGGGGDAEETLRHAANEIRDEMHYSVNELQPETPQNASHPKPDQ